MTLGTAVGVNFLAGMGGYAIDANTNPNMQFNAGQMFLAGFNQASKAVVNYALGGLMGATGIWQVGNTPTMRAIPGFKGAIMRSAVKNLFNHIPFSILNGIYG